MSVWTRAMVEACRQTIQAYDLLVKHPASASRLSAWENYREGGSCLLCAAVETNDGDTPEGLYRGACVECPLREWVPEDADTEGDFDEGCHHETMTDLRWALESGTADEIREAAIARRQWLIDRFRAQWIRVGGRR